MDFAILEKCRQGDRMAQAAMYLHYWDKIFRFVMRMVKNGPVAEELTQDTFVKVLMNIHTVDSVAYLKNWMYHVARNVVISYFRKYKHEKKIRDGGTDPETAQSSGNSRYPLHSELPGAYDVIAVSEMNTALERLSLREQYLLKSQINGLSYEEVAEILGDKLATVKTRILRSRAKMRALMPDYVRAA